MAIVRSHIDVALGAAKRRLLQPRAPDRGRSSRRDRRSSVTDQTSYLDVCARAAEDPRVFETFRREPVYVEALEHVTEDQGAQYLRLIQRDSPHLLGERLEAFRANDRLGSPITYEYPGVGRLSPVTIRYLKVLSDLERHFGDLAGKRIIEIGVGYGGQCRLVLEHWAVQTYTLVDLEPVLGLARRYLARFGTHPSVVFQTPELLASANYDLCISNYAFSELSREVQAFYAESVVGAASQGYLTCNFVSGLFGIESWSKEELSHLHTGAHWLPEQPITHEGNAILVWGDTVGASRRPRSDLPDMA